MRKIIATEFYTLDGMMSDPKDEMEWVLNIFSEDVGKYEDSIYDQVDTLILGRVTFKIFEGHWPNIEENTTVDAGEKVLGKKINNAVKIVFSKTIKETTWNKSIIMEEINPGEISRMKNEKGKDMLIVGSSEIVRQFANLDLIDEYHLLLHPVILGNGKRLFNNTSAHKKLKLLNTKIFSNSVVGLFYGKES